MRSTLTYPGNRRIFGSLYGCNPVVALPRFDFLVTEASGIYSISHGVFTMSKRTFQPNNRRRAKVHGFRARMRTRAGRAIVAARRGKGRTKLTA